MTLDQLCVLLLQFGVALLIGLSFFCHTNTDAHQGPYQQTLLIIMILK